MMELKEQRVVIEQKFAIPILTANHFKPDAVRIGIANA